MGRVGQESEGVPAIFVLGMHRSGTSALSRVLSLLGYAQASTLMKANDFNPVGYWEPQPVVALNDAYLWGMKRYWGDPKPFDPADDLRRYDRAVEDAKAVLADQFDLTAGFVLKDPRVSLGFPVWREAAVAVGAAPKALIALRNPLSVCRSLRTRDAIKTAHGEKLWINYTLQAEKRSRGVPRAVVHYEDIMGDWRAVVAQAFDGMGLGGPKFSQAGGAQIDSFLDAGLNHSEATDAQLAANAQISPMAKDLYALLRQEDGLEQGAVFDAFGAQWQANWDETSKGKGPSFYARRFPDWHLRRSAEAQADGDMEGAFEACNKAIELAPLLAQAHFRLAKLHFDQQDYDLALVAVVQAIELKDSRLHYHMLQARVLSQLERPQEALEAATSAVACDADWAEAHFLCGKLLVGLAQSEAAIDAFQRAVELAPDRGSFQAALAQAQGALKPPVVALKPVDPRVAQALAHLGAQEWAQALTIYTELAKDPEAAFSVLQNYTTALLRLGHVEPAILALERMVAMEPKSARHHFMLATQRTLVGDWAGATQARNDGLALGLPEVVAFLESPEAGGAAPNPYMVQAFFAWQSAKHWRQSLEFVGLGNDPALWPLGDRPVLLEKPAVAAVSEGDRPELSVMLPVYNVQNEAWLRGALDSVVGQVGDAEIVVVDDASSTDVARDVAADYGGRVTYVRNDAQAGLLGNHNRCLAVARGQFVHILHQDDWVKGGFYDALLGPLRENPALSMAFCAARIVDEVDTRLRVPARLANTPGVLGNWLERIVHGQLISFPTVIARRSAYEAIGGFTPSLTFAFDWEMWGRLASAGQVWHDPTELAVYRNHAGSATQLFTARERLIDTFHTIAGLLSLLPEHKARQIVDHSLQRVLANGWGQLRTMGRDAEGLPEMIEFLHQGCDSGGDPAHILPLFE